MERTEEGAGETDGKGMLDRWKRRCGKQGLGNAVLFSWKVFSTMESWVGDLADACVRAEGTGDMRMCDGEETVCVVCYLLELRLSCGASPADGCPTASGSIVSMPRLPRLM